MNPNLFYGAVLIEPLFLSAKHYHGPGRYQTCPFARRKHHGKVEAYETAETAVGQALRISWV